MSNQLLHHSVINHAAASPHACAFWCAGKQISYAELDTKSNQVAHLLMQQGVVKGDRVGVFMPRCVETVVAVYGILKAGGVFVPLDPHLNDGSLAQLVGNCEIKTLLTHDKKKRVLESLLSRETTVECTIGISSNFTRNPSVRAIPWDAIEACPTDLPDAPSIEANDAAYIMYSSGSTGQPKGITHSHFSGMSYAKLSVTTYGVTSEDIIANHSPISFDMSTFGYFAAMLAGAKTVLIPEAYTKIPSSLAGLIEDQKVTIWYSVPLALVQLLLRGNIAGKDCSAMRWVKFGGEPFPPKYLRALMKLWPDATFSNVYGPAEVNQCTFFHLPTSFADQCDNTPVPIGKVWDETRGIVLDDNDRPVHGAGQSGELLIQSPTRMLGYWNRPEQTAGRLWQSPDSSQPDQTYYRTGDLVSIDEHGNMTFLGRKDRQVKIRGYRIELEEIENVMNALADVEEAGVYCIVSDETKELHASVILSESADTDQEKIKTQMAESLSAYSIPTKIHLVKQLPRTVSGKIDRNQLTRTAEGQPA